MVSHKYIRIVFCLLFCLISVHCSSMELWPIVVDQIARDQGVTIQELHQKFSAAFLAGRAKYCPSVAFINYVDDFIAKLSSLSSQESFEMEDIPVALHVQEINRALGSDGPVYLSELQWLIDVLRAHPNRYLVTEIDFSGYTADDYAPYACKKLVEAYSLSPHKPLLCRMPSELATVFFIEHAK